MFRRRVDWPILAAAALLVAIGLDALRATERSVAGVPLMHRQLAWLGLALVAAAGVAAVPARLIKLAWLPAWVATVAALSVVLMQPPINGARSWFRLGAVSMQPSELAKLTVGLSLAAVAGSYRRLRARQIALLAGLVAVPMALTLLQPDVGSAAVLVPMWLGVLFAAGASWRWLTLHAVVIAAAALAAWPALTPEQKARFTSFLRQRDLGPPELDEGYQLHQSKRIIVQAGLLGSRSALEVHLPMAHNDFVFALVVGRRGLVGAVAVIASVVVITVRLLRRAARADDRSSALLAVAVACWLAAQALTNVAMTVGLAPITGITLPLVSYGGTSLLSVVLALTLSMKLTAPAATPSCAMSVRAPRWETAWIGR